MEQFSIFDWSWSSFFSPERIASLARLGVLLFVAAPAAYLLSKTLRAYVSRRYSAQQGMVAGKFVLYLGLAIVGISVLSELGFRLTTLLGAAGIIGIAVGFASQTSVSNLISGLFLIAEKPFIVNDLITVGDTTGQVLSIDLLSVKLRTFDNKFVRIPNETIMKSQLTNVSHFPIRRLDVQVGVAYKEDVGKVRRVLIEVARQNPLCLQEPEPLVIFSGFGNSSIDLLFAVWAARSDWLKLKNSIQEEIKRRFDDEGIEIPFPHLSLYSGLATEPFRITLVGADDKSRENAA